MDEEYTLIEDPLAWQAKIDASGRSPNSRGSIRFWTTVMMRGLNLLYKDGGPDFTEIVLDLGGGIGLQLKTDEETPYIRYRFVNAGDYEEGNK